MKLVIGGNFQGKSRWAAQQWNIDFADGASAPLAQLLCSPAVNHLEAAVARLLERGEDPLAWGRRFLKENPEAVVICDEVGCGVVPMEKKERDYRESVGRVCCLLAENAEEVYRIWCGIARRIR